MTPEDVTFFSTVMTTVLMFIVLFAITKTITNDMRKRYFNFIGKKRVEKYLKEGWKIAGHDDKGYPRILEKNNELKVL